MASPVLMRDIAAAAGVHHTTVSRALRNDPRISTGVRAKIKKLAGRLGYTPDPHLRALASYRLKNRPREFHGTLAWLTNHPRRDDWRLHEKISYHEGACRRAGELGYKLETFWAREPETTPARLRQIMLARGIRGILLPPQPVPGTIISLKMDEFAAVSFGHALAAPLLHVVHHDHYRSMQRLLSELGALGYRRPGIALTGLISRMIDGTWAAAYFLHAHDHRLSCPPPLLDDTWGRTEFLAWYRANRPDVIVSHVGETLHWLRAAGIRVPEDCGFAMPARHVGHPACAGIDENSTAIGEAAVDLLVSLIEHGETGLPRHPKAVMIEGAWSPDKTVRSRRSIPKTGQAKP